MRSGMTAYFLIQGFTVTYIASHVIPSIYTAAVAKCSKV